MRRRPTYRIGVAARLTGLSEEVIRAWERRYGVVRPTRTPGGYRVYSDADVAVLRRLRELTASGVAIAEASRLVHASPRAAAAPPAGARDQPFERWRAAVLAAAERLDQEAVDAVLDEALATLPVLRVFQDLIVPVAREAGERWHEGRLGVAEEHLVTQVVRARLLAVLHANRNHAGRQALCACFPDEQHDLGLLGAALRFRQAGFRVTYLGQRTPVEQLVHAARKLRPEVVALACTTDPGVVGIHEVLAAVRAVVSARARLVVGGGAAGRYREAIVAANVIVLGDHGDESAWRRALA